MSFLTNYLSVAEEFTNYFIQTFNNNSLLLVNSMTDYTMLSLNEEPLIQGSYQVAQRLSSLGYQNLSVLPENYFAQPTSNGGLFIVLYGTVSVNMGGIILQSYQRNIFISMIIDNYNNLFYLTNLAIKIKEPKHNFDTSRQYQNNNLGHFNIYSHPYGYYGMMDTSNF